MELTKHAKPSSVMQVQLKICMSELVKKIGKL